MDSGASFYRRLGILSSSPQRAALATVVRVEGETPGKPGFKLLLFEDGRSEGTVGGGCVEEGVKELAKEVMDEGKARNIEFSLKGGKALCGGRIKVFIEPL